MTSTSSSRRLHPANPGEPHLRAWYEPAAALCRCLRDDPERPVHLEDLVYVGRLPDGQGPELWVYRHEPTGGEVIVDDWGNLRRPAAGGGVVIPFRRR